MKNGERLPFRLMISGDATLLVVSAFISLGLNSQSERPRVHSSAFG